MFKNWFNYGGCFSKDEVNSQRCKNGKFYIINLDTISGQGTHWTLFDLTDNKTNMYYDSFSAPPPSQLQKVLMKSKKDFIMNDLYDNEQRLNSISCGYFCLFMMLLRKSGKSPKECITLMNDKNIRGNEDIMKYLYELIKNKLK